jgi:hypothetical protein
LILKLDFAKAFDTAEQEATLKMSECLGFDPVDVVKNDYVHRNVFGSFEWCVREEFYLSEGVWQGDPSSPLFFSKCVGAPKSYGQSVVPKWCVACSSKYT